MNRRLNRTWPQSLIALAVLLTVPGLAPPSTPVTRASPGAPAPAFSLTDAHGKTHRLSDYTGRIVVLEWIDPACPLVKGRLYAEGVMQRIRRDVRALDGRATWLAIDSTTKASAQRGRAWADEQKIADPLLLDPTGTTGRAYGARRTPHMFVIDRQGVLRYHGALDDNRGGGKPPSDVMNYVVNAVRQIVNGDPVNPGAVRPYGCEMKYKKKEARRHEGT